MTSKTAARLATAPAIAVPSITLEGDANGTPHAEASAYAGIDPSDRP
jgi:hypothetical protein